MDLARNLGLRGLTWTFPATRTSLSEFLLRSGLPPVSSLLSAERRSFSTRAKRSASFLSVSLLPLLTHSPSSVTATLLEASGGEYVSLSVGAFLALSPLTAGMISVQYQFLNLTLGASLNASLNATILHSTPLLGPNATLANPYLSLQAEASADDTPIAAVPAALTVDLPSVTLPTPTVTSSSVQAKPTRSSNNGASLASAQAASAQAAASQSAVKAQAQQATEQAAQQAKNDAAQAAQKVKDDAAWAASQAASSSSAAAAAASSKAAASAQSVKDAAASAASAVVTPIADAASSSSRLAFAVVARADVSLRRRRHRWKGNVLLRVSI